MRTAISPARTAQHGGQPHCGEAAERERLPLPLGEGATPEAERRRAGTDSEPTPNGLHTFANLKERASRLSCHRTNAQHCELGHCARKTVQMGPPWPNRVIPLAGRMHWHRMQRCCGPGMWFRYTNGADKDCHCHGAGREEGALGPLERRGGPRRVCQTWTAARTIVECRRANTAGSGL